MKNKTKIMVGHSSSGEAPGEACGGRREVLGRLLGIQLAGGRLLARAGLGGGILLGTGTLGGCASSSEARKRAAAKDARQRALAAALEGGQRVNAEVVQQIRKLPTLAGEVELWIYLPVSAIRARRVAVIYTTPPDGELVTGAKLSRRDHAKYTAWAQAGYIVMAYSTQGGVTAQASDAEFDAGVAGFMRSRGGLDDLGAGLEYESKHLRELVSGRIWIGEKAAATHALMAAAMGFPLDGLVAIDALLSASSELQEVIAELSPEDPRVNFWRWFSPLRFAGRIRVPLLLGFSDKAKSQEMPWKGFLSSLPRGTSLRIEGWSAKRPWGVLGEPVLSWVKGLELIV